MGQVARLELRGNVPSINPIVFRGVKKMRFLELLDETGVEHVDLDIFAPKLEVALQVHCGMHGVAASVFKPKQDL